MDDGDARHWLPPFKNGKPKVLTDARKAQGGVVASESDKGGREYRSLSAPLEFYVARGSITGEQYHAGLRLLALWMKSVRSPYTQMAYEDREGAGVVEHFPIGAFAAEYRAALFSVSGVNERKVVHAVCCEDVAASRCLPYPSRATAKRRGMRYLRSGLDDLIAHFKRS